MKEEKDQAVAEKPLKKKKEADRYFPNADQTNENVTLYPRESLHYKLVNRALSRHFQGAVPKKDDPHRIAQKRDRSSFKIIGKLILCL